jgi:hypothetical protein
MAKSMCEVGKKKAKDRLLERPKYECRKCRTLVKKKDWVCKPGKI